jgi:prepilin-type N-terminal cleavage/methylation domain-containing protein/prepilin-type processing-associated H-X9-DG protein
MKRTIRLRWARGLTLIELLVVIVISGILAAMLLTAGIAARERKQRTNCLSNLKRMAAAMGMYAAEHKGSENITLVGTLQVLSNVLPSARVLYCPGDKRPGARPEADFSKLTTMNISYSYVPGLLWSDVPDSIVALDRVYATASGSLWPTNGNHKGAGGNVLFNDGHAQWFNTLPSALKDKDGQSIVLSP